MSIERPRSSASYAYYSFPPTPNRSTSSTASPVSLPSKTPSPQTARTSKSAKSATRSIPKLPPKQKDMAPSPAAGRKAQAPTTPTKQGKNPASSATSKLGQASGAAGQASGAGEQAQGTAKSATNTPKQAAGGAADKAKQAAGGPTASPKLPPRPKAGQAGQQAAGAAKGTPKAAQKPVGDAKQKAKETTGADVPGTDDAQGAAEGAAEGAAGQASQAGNDTGEDISSAAEGDLEDVTGGAQETPDIETADDETAEETAEETADETADEAGGALGGVADKAKGAAEGAAGKAKDAAGDVAEGDAEGLAEDAQDAAGSAAEDVQDAAEDAQDTAEDAVPDEAQDAVDGIEDQADGLTDNLPDLSILKGLEVGEGGEILDQEGKPIGQLEEGDPEDLVGHTIGDDGEILDEDGDVIGRVGILPDKIQELQDKAKDGLPDVNVLQGLEVGEGGEILGPDGSPLGKITEGNPEDLIGLSLNENGEILDEDGDVIGRAEVVPGEAASKIQEQLAGAGDVAGGLKPDLSILQGKKINKKGNILDEEGEPIGKLTEDSDPKKCAGKIPNEDGLIIDDDGNIVGKVEIVEGEAANEAMKALHPELVEQLEGAAEEAGEGVEEPEIPGLPGLDILEGLKVNKKGEVLNEDGEPIARLSEGELGQCIGKKLNANGEILDADGDVIGKVELVPEAFLTPGLPGLDILEGLKVNKKGEVLNEDGEPIAKLSEGELEDCVGKKLNANGEILDQDGNVVGKVELIPEAFPEVAEAAELAELSKLKGLKVNKKGEVVDEDGEPIARLVDGDLAECTSKTINEKGEVVDDDGNVIGKVELITPPEEAEGEEGPDYSGLEGYKVNKSGKVVNEDGETLATLVEGEIEDCAGKKLNANGEVVDADGNVIGRVELEGPPEDEGPEYPPLSVLEGCKCNKNGKIVDAEGNPRGELVEGDPKRLAKLGVEADAEGQFWDSKGNVIGRAQTLPVTPDEEEAPFAGLEGLVVVDDGWVEDENQNKVGKLVEGDPKKLVGRAVDEDGDVIDKHGNIVGHAERLEEEELPAPDLSVLQGLAVNKQGNVIGPDGVPIARLVEGNAKDLAGKVCDELGQIWNDQGKIIGRCELIPEEEREAKPEGPFAGLEGCVVTKDGMVEDEEGNTVGQVVEGDPKKLVGRAVDEDGDIIDKYGNVKGHAERYEEPEEEIADLSSLEGKIVNKAGNVVDEHGTIYGRIAEGDPKELAGKKVDGQGQIWSDNGKVIGQAELIPGGGTQKPEGPFTGFENLVVAKDGMVTDGSGQEVGILDDESMPNADKLLGRKVDEDGDILDNSGNPIGHAVRYKAEEKERHINPMSGHKVNKDGEVRDENGELLGVVTDGHLPTMVGCEVDDNGYVIDNDGNKIGECTLLQNLPDEEEGPTEEELQRQKNAEIAKKMNGIIVQTIEKMQPICKDITELIEAAERKPKEELDEEELVKQVKPKIEEGNRILQECNGALRGLDPDGSIAAQAKERSASGEATKEEHQLANSLKELTSTIVTTIENAKKKIAGMPHAKKELNPLWYLLTEPLFQIIAAVGLLLSGVLGLVGKLLNGLGLGGLVNGLLGGLGIEKLLNGMGLGSVTKSLGLGGKK